ncbi:unnamed protein product [Taenia asiatica]|uniref:Cadherin domain-containing protein n=1 Tax=Taenia asiatica TaxID=60517 RepID=A0A0R3WA90_TAEAS|nr:unnamed protein product [Taenia asiatica]
MTPPGRRRRVFGTQTAAYCLFTHLQYKNDISQVVCPESLIGPPGRTCRLARLTISHVIPADEGIYRARIVEANTTNADCSPCTGELNLRVFVNENGAG